MNPPSTSQFSLTDYEQAATEKDYFPLAPPTLLLSNKCRPLQDCPMHAWMFQVIALYQEEKDFTETTQRWEFVRIRNEVWVSCLNSEGHKLVDRTVNIFDCVHFFSDQVVYTESGKCWLKKEYESIKHKLLSA